MAMTSNITPVICEPFVRGQCSHGNQCPRLHHVMPYLWQVYQPDSDRWLPLTDSEKLEQQFANPGSVSLEAQISHRQADGSDVIINMEVEPVGTCMKAVVTSPQPGVLPGNSVSTTVRRLSTESYAEARAKYMEDEGACSSPWAGFCTQWRWYWESDGGKWSTFNQDPRTPSQQVLETKFLAKQEVFRFEMEALGASHKLLIFLLDFRKMRLQCLSDKNSWPVRRRPLYLSSPDKHQGKFLPQPTLITGPFTTHLPDNWLPLDPQQEAELVPLNPESLEFHLVASEVVRSLAGRVIADVFRIQNPYVWHKFRSKRLYMESRGREVNEMQLFHGTSDESVVQAIVRKNFDWRVCGKNATMYGKGVYFALNAAFSDRYTSKSVSAPCWMFMARVQVGRFTKGHSNLVRPPPMNELNPNADLYDSCVDNVNSPTIYVIFDSDQCYPEYLISYRLKT